MSNEVARHFYAPHKRRTTRSLTLKGRTVTLTERVAGRPQTSLVKLSHDSISEAQAFYDKLGEQQKILGYVELKLQ
jgi:hypothetical protein